MANLLDALVAITSLKDTDIIRTYSRSLSSNRINSVGEAFECFVKDAFANSFSADDAQRNWLYRNTFSYLGNQNNPPDAIIRSGDAIEIKKIKSSTSSIALNSSYPKSVLRSDSNMITEECKKCEQWIEKDIIYAVGIVPSGKISSIWFVYGNCYAADRSIYERIRSKISEGVRAIPSIELAATNELGKIKSVDPLGITTLRIRGMWHIDNPSSVFSYLSDSRIAGAFAHAIMLADKYSSFPRNSRDSIEKRSDGRIKKRYVEIKNPNNPAKLMNAVYIMCKIG